MAAGGAGWFHENYNHDNWWHDEWWSETATVVPDLPQGRNPQKPWHNCWWLPLLIREIIKNVT